MKVYALLLFALVTVVTVFGVVAPALISARNSLGVALGFGLIAICAPVVFWVFKEAWQDESVQKFISKFKE